MENVNLNNLSDRIKLFTTIPEAPLLPLNLFQIERYCFYCLTLVSTFACAILPSMPMWTNYISTLARKPSRHSLYLSMS
jgi:hypothetical protein